MNVPSQIQRVGPQSFDGLLRRLAVAAVLLLALFAFGAPAAAQRNARTPVIEFDVAGTPFAVDAAAGMGGFATQAAAVATQHWPRIAERSGAPTGQLVRIHIERQFVDWFEREGVPSRPPEWAAGLAIPSRRVILLAPGAPDWEKTAHHEMAHVAVAMAANDEHVPVWFTEGFAVLLAEQWSLERATTMMQAGINDGFHDFRELDQRWPAVQGPADLAYAQSFHFVRWLMGRHGDDIFLRVMARLRGGGTTFEDAFRDETDTLLSIEMDAWRRGVQTRYRWAPMVSTGGFLWVLLMVPATLAWRRRRRMRREQLAQMARDEAGLFRNDPDDQTFG